MKLVTATKRGFYGKLRDRGDVFAVPDNFEASWVEGGAEIPEEAKEPTQAEMSIEELLEDLELRTDAEIQNMLDTEIAGKKRKGLIAKLTDEIENRTKLLA